MKQELIHEICRLMNNHLTQDQNKLLKNTLSQVFTHFGLPDSSEQTSWSYVKI